MTELRARANAPVRRFGEHVVSEDRARDLRDRWQRNRSVVRCQRDVYDDHYVGGYRVDILPSADDQARRMR